jgi:hypothetical protein
MPLNDSMKALSVGLPRPGEVQRARTYAARMGRILEHVAICRRQGIVNGHPTQAPAACRATHGALASRGDLIIGHDGFDRVAAAGEITETCGALEVLMAHRPAATLSNAKGKREAPSLSANVVCSHSSQTNRSEPAMYVSAISWTQVRKCLCAVTFPHPKHSFTIISSRPSQTVARDPDAVPKGQSRLVTHHLPPKPKRRMLTKSRPILKLI